MEHILSELNKIVNGYYKIYTNYPSHKGCLQEYLMKNYHI